MSNLAPFMKIYNKDGNEISFKKLNRFLFVHSEEADDHSTIEVQTLDPSLVDSPDFNEGAKVNLLFGFIGGKKSKKYTMFVIDIKPIFGPSGIILTITLGDKFQYAKHTSKKRILEGSPAEVAGAMAKENGLEFKGIDFFGQFLINRSFLINRDGIELEPQLIRGTEASIRKEDSFNTTAIDNTSVPLLRKIFLPQANKSDAAAIREIMETQPGGPWVVTGHNDELIIKNRNFHQKAIRTYKYKGYPEGLIKFTPETKNKSHKQKGTTINVGSWDPLKKEYYQGRVTQNNSSNQLLNQTTEFPPLGSIQQEAEAWEKKVKDNYKFGTQEKGSNPQDTAYKPNQKTQTFEGDDTEISNPNFKDNPEDNIANKPNLENPNIVRYNLPDIGNGKKWAYIKLDRQTPTTVLERYAVNTAAVDNTNVVSQGYELVDIKQNQETVTEDSKEENATKAVNKRDEEALMINSAEALLIGDPEIESGSLLGILNVSKRYSGKWYITSASHEIDFSGGYTLTCKLVTNSLGKTGSESPTTIPAEDLGIATNTTDLDSQDNSTYKTLGT